VGEPASGLGGVQVAAGETSASDGDWLSAINVAEGWGDGVDDGAIVELVSLEHRVLHTAQVCTTPSHDQSWIKQPGIGWSRHGDRLLGDGRGSTSDCTKHDLHVAKLGVELSIIEPVTNNVDGVSLPAKVRVRGCDDGSMSEHWARNHLGWHIPPDRHSLGGQAVAARNTLNSDCRVGVTGLNGHVDGVEQDGRIGIVEPLNVEETTTVEGDREVGSWVGVAIAGAQRCANRTIVISWTPHLALVAYRLNCNRGFELDVNQHVSVEICSSGRGGANNWVVQISWSSHD